MHLKSPEVENSLELLRPDELRCLEGVERRGVSARTRTYALRFIYRLFTRLRTERSNMDKTDVGGGIIHQIPAVPKAEQSTVD